MPPASMQSRQEIAGWTTFVGDDCGAKLAAAPIGLRSSDLYSDASAVNPGVFMISSIHFFEFIVRSTGKLGHTERDSLSSYPQNLLP